MLLSIIPEQVCDLHCSYCFRVLFGFFVFWSFVLCFVFPSLEFSVAGWRSVNLTLPFLNHENGDFSILMRDISYLKIVSSSRFCNSEVSLWTLLCYCCWSQGLFAELICSHWYIRKDEYFGSLAQKSSFHHIYQKNNDLRPLHYWFIVLYHHLVFECANNNYFKHESQ
jgi:hypothetical protein